MEVQHDASWKMVLADESDPRQAARSKGLHLSTIIHDLDVTLYHKDRDNSEPISAHYAKRGFLFENMLSRAFALEECPKTRLNQLELKSDGIFMTPDGWVVDTGELDEYKATDYSMKKLSPDLSQDEWQHNWRKYFRTWDWQIQSYLWRLGMVVCNLYIFFVRGDYKFNGVRGVDTIPKFVLRYQPWELSETWRSILNHRDSMVGQGKVIQLGPDDYHVVGR
jgi:hypothetical protein